MEVFSKHQRIFCARQSAEDRLDHSGQGPWLLGRHTIDIIVDDESFGHIFGDVYGLAVEHGLSGYDAAYLELAMRKDLPLATLDEDLQKAATASGVELVNHSG